MYLVLLINKLSKLIYIFLVDNYYEQITLITKYSIT